MILDKMVDLEVARAAGFIEGLNAAAEYHDKEAKWWLEKAKSVGATNEAIITRSSDHKDNAIAIRNLKERSTPNGQEDA